MKTKRVLPHYYINTKRDKQYDDALHEYLRSTWKLPGRTHTQIARGLGLGDPSKDKEYGLAIMYALHDFAENDSATVSWHPNLRLKEADLQKSGRRASTTITISSFTKTRHRGKR